MLLLGLALLACREPTPTVVAPETVWVAGCEAWIDERCLIDGTADLVVWHDGARDVPWTLSVGGSEHTMPWEADEAIARGEAAVAPGQTVQLLGHGRATWRLEVGAIEDVPGLTEPAALYEHAREVEAEDAIVLLDSARASYDRLGDVLGRVRVATFGSFLRAQVGRDLIGARDILDELGDLPPIAEVHMWRHWAYGILETRVGRFGAAVDHFREQARLAELAGERARARAARGEVAHLLQLSGQHGPALAMHAEVAAEDVGDTFCFRARALNNLGWAAIVATRRGAHTDRDPRQVLEQARAALGQDCKDRPGLEADILLNLALATEAGGLAEVSEALALATPALSHPTVEQVLEMRSLEARMARADGRLAEALTGFEAVRRRAAEAGRVHVEWEALAEQARVLVMLDRDEAAIRRFEEADAMAAEHAVFVPITLGRDAFLAERDRAARDHVALLLSLGRDEEALGVVRRLRAGFVASLRQAKRLDSLDADARRAWDAAVGTYQGLREEREALARDAWKVDDTGRAALESRLTRLQERTRRLLDDALPAVGLSTPVLRDPEPGEVLVVWFEDRDGWVVFVADVEGVASQRTSTSPEDLRTVGGLAAARPGATRLLLMPYGTMRTLDLHTRLAPEGAVVPALPFVWSLDIGKGETLAPAASSLVVADPRGDLPWARREGEEVAALLGDGVTRLVQDDASHQALRDAIPSVELLHYAGHGAFGTQPWDAELLTARDGRFSVADILALERVPLRVVLSGCETARTRDTALENLGLAQAFVTAGAQAAVASVRRVDDELARAMSAALYRHGFHTGDPAVAFRASVLDVAASDPSADVGSFRLIVP